MTYFGFLGRFLVVPIIILCIMLWRNQQRGRTLPAAFTSWPFWTVIVGHIVVAVLYTTPWDNYLVATEVWWYDENLVTGIVIGYVPIEEYTFFVLQTWMTGMWVVWLMQSWPDYFAPDGFQLSTALRRNLTWAMAIIWLVSTILLFSGYAPTTYLTLILSWVLIPVMIQFSFGADILWHYRRILFWGVVPTTLFLGAADALAISAGTWTISPSQTVGIYLGSILPIEEFLFFFVTNVLVVFGSTLVLARHSHGRFDRYLIQLQQYSKRTAKSPHT